ncbi:phosphoribosyltransferase-like protein [Paeniglutamicibacter sulfureus]|uniref:PRTase-CE domain-containing protein n=1 Tax=Paeniglutamicibacter sulfureus TaxID=43666 RepID=A0ABU2BF27_9MICC|nr:hypothetical protein [Paeniglutamicibacter sulfureus]MDR7357247.1 hypothetical protein [Paeniglutamicibacter sulfureus]
MKVQEFISRFPNAEQKDIEDLTSAITVVDLSRLQNDMYCSIVDTIEEKRSENQTVVIDAVAAKGDIAAWMKREAEKTGDDTKKVEELFLYKDFQPSEIFHDKSGSEHFSAVVRRDVTSHLQNAEIKTRYKELNNDTVENIHFVFITDNSGSGMQIIEFLDLCIRSIGDLLNQKKMTIISIISWGATRRSIEAVNDSIRQFFIDNLTVESRVKIEFQYLNYIDTVHDFEDVELRERLLLILKKYGGKKTYMGHESVASLTVFEGHNCPNTLPQVYFHDKSVKPPLFPRKYVTSEACRDMSAHFRRYDRPGFVNLHESRLKRANLVLASKIAKRERASLWLYLCYAAIGETNSVAMALLQCSQQEKIGVRNELRVKGWIDAQGRSTAEGNLALRTYARRNRHKVQPKFSKYVAPAFDENIEEYYPTSVDGVSWFSG